MHKWKKILSLSLLTSMLVSTTLHAEQLSNPQPIPPGGDNPSLYITNEAGQWIMASDGRWWYQLSSGGYVANRWAIIQNQWYYFDSAGWMADTVFGYKMTSGNDAEYFINNVSSKNPAIANWNCTSDLLDSTYYSGMPTIFSNSEYIKYWSSHGRSQGYVYGNGGAKYDYSSKSNLNIANNNLEFVFLAACYQLDAGPRPKWARSMQGNAGIRVVAGYNDRAPTGGLDTTVAQTFMAYAKGGESVKSSWMKANEDNQLGYNYCVLTHAGDVQYSRFVGFGGNPYARPTTGQILRFTKVNSNGTPQSFSYNGLNYKTDITSLLSADIPSYSLKAMPLHIGVKEESDLMVIREKEQLTTSGGELKDTVFDNTDEQIATDINNWVNYNFVGYDSKMLEGIDPEIDRLVKAEVNLDGTEEIEETVGYTVKYNHTMDGIPIDGDIFSVMIDAEGVKHSNTNWSNMEKIEQKTLLSEPVQFEEAASLISNKIASSTYSLEMQCEDGESVADAKLAFVLNSNTGLYEPAWQFIMDHGEELSVLCSTGTIIEK